MHYDTSDAGIYRRIRTSSCKGQVLVSHFTVNMEVLKLPNENIPVSIITEGLAIEQRFQLAITPKIN